MADKYLNVALGVTAVITPLKVDGVVKILVATAAGANPKRIMGCNYRGRKNALEFTSISFTRKSLDSNIFTR